MKAFSLVCTLLLAGLMTICPGVNQSEAAKPYVLGYQTDLTGVARASYAPIAEGFRLYMDLVNDRGGVNGHPIKVIYEDDKSEASLAGGIAEKFITSDEVLAICGLGFSRSQPPVKELTRKAGVPLITGYTAIGHLYPPDPTKNMFSVGVLMDPKAMPQGVVNALVCSKVHPRGKVAVTSFSTPGGRLVDDWTEAWCKKLSMNVVYRDEYPPTTQEFTPWLMKIAEGKPQVVTATVGGAIYIPFLRQMQKFGLGKTDLVVPDFVSEEDLVKGVKQLGKNGGDNVIWFSRYASALDVDRPSEFDNIEKAMKKYDHKYVLSSLHSMGWTLARLMESALKRAGWPCTRSDLLAALEKTELDTKGLTGGPIRFSATNHYGPSWWIAYRWDSKRGKLKRITDWHKLELSEIVGKIGK